MKPVAVVGLSVALAALGTWSQKHTITTKQVIGGAFVAIVITILQDTAPKLAQQFSWVILATVAGTYGQDLFESVGNITSETAKVATTGKTTPGATGTKQQPR